MRGYIQLYGERQGEDHRRPRPRPARGWRGDARLHRLLHEGARVLRGPGLALLPPRGHREEVRAGVLRAGEAVPGGRRRRASRAEGSREGDRLRHIRPRRARQTAVAARIGLFPVSALLRLADLQPTRVELVITGRGAHPSLKKRAGSRHRDARGKALLPERGEGGRMKVAPPAPAVFVRFRNAISLSSCPVDGGSDRRSAGRARDPRRTRRDSGDREGPPAFSEAERNVPAREGKVPGRERFAPANHGRHP